MKISLFSPAGATLYAIVRNRSDGQVWNGSAFEAWSDGSIGTYDVPLTDHGGDYYSVTFPGGITLDGTLYDVGVYKQAGGSPAITDIMLTVLSDIAAQDALHDLWSVIVGQVTPSGTTTLTLAYLAPDDSTTQRTHTITTATGARTQA